mmetsp:Transcript_2757/g.9694  ORF Transcript_2757/g.9694 Transcript_2757/m.9694 type:complete len:428 (-) Transcript_2757:165-1448(-)
MNDERFLGLLGKLVGEAETLQDNPPDLVPREDNASQHVLDILAPYTGEGGPIKAERVSFEEGRGNLILTYPGKTERTIAFVGSHLDVVPANPETWERNPFELSVEGDKLYGRGTTDCLGHVAAITELFLQLAERKVALDVTVVAVFIASEEAEAKPGVGVDGLVEAGKLEFIKNGPVIWVDSADSQPCIGTAGAMMWHLKAIGKLFHSGLPHKGINALELGMEAVKIIQERFYADFPAHPKEEEYAFATCSTMKPTQMSCAKGGLNQLPPHATISGDIRLTPFYEVEDVRAKVESYVAELNADLGSIPTRGPHSTYTIADGTTGKLELTWGAMALEGIACNLTSPGYKALCKATEEVKGVAKPYAICGSLPLVRSLQREGFDLQVTGYGLSDTYHADNEYALHSDLRDAVKILARIVAEIDEGLAKK